MDTPSNYYHKNIQLFLKDKKLSNCLILNNTLSYTNDVQKQAKSLYQKISIRTRVVVITFNFLWKPILDFASLIKLRKNIPLEPNWLTKNDIRNMFLLEGLQETKAGNFFLLPIDLGIISKFINKIIANLPIINNLCLNSYQIFRKIPHKRDYSVSIIIPAKNESGNIKGILQKIPKIGTKTEVIFIEGGSSDETMETIIKEIHENNKKKLDVYVYKQTGKGKKDAVKLGFSKAKNDILIILDADLTVNPKDLSKFYFALAKGHAEFANGSRLVYPLQKDSMRTLNYLGNVFFSALFTFLLDQNIKDTLCGTKALFRKDYLRIKERQLLPDNLDPFGDFDLLFGATKENLKIIDIPVRYSSRKYGQTNIKRIKNGVELLKMTILAAKKIKFN